MCFWHVEMSNQVAQMVAGECVKRRAITLPKSQPMNVSTQDV